MLQTQREEIYAYVYIYMYGMLQTQREEITEYDALENTKLQTQREEIYIYIYIRLAPNPKGGDVYNDCLLQTPREEKKV